MNCLMESARKWLLPFSVPLCLCGGLFFYA